jgi:hypothetical protein
MTNQIFGFALSQLLVLFDYLIFDILVLVQIYNLGKNRFQLKSVFIVFVTF